MGWRSWIGKLRRRQVSSFSYLFYAAHFFIECIFTYLTVFYVPGILSWLKNMVWRYHNLDSGPVVDLRGRWQRGRTIEKFTSMPLTFLPNFYHFYIKMSFLMLWNVLLNIFMYLLVKRFTHERPGWCSDPDLPPCAAYALSSYFIQSWIVIYSFVYRPYF
jgi:hypothetical protein